MVSVWTRNILNAFFKFFNLDSIEKNKSSFGIGLAVYQKIVEWDGGKIRAELEFGNGSTSCFTSL